MTNWVLTKASRMSDYRNVSPWYDGYQVGSANVKTAWRQVSSEIIEGGLLSVVCFGDTAGESLFDVAIGGSGSEEIIINNIHRSHTTNVSRRRPVLFSTPLYIPKGERIAIRSQCKTASAWQDISVQIDGGGNYCTKKGLSKCVTYGANTGDSGGTSYDPGASGYTFGSWTQIVASIPYRYRGIIIGIGNRGNTGRANYLWRCQIGLSSSPGDAVIAEFSFVEHMDHDVILPSNSYLINCDIPLGEEIHFRAMCSGTDGTDRLFDYLLYCFA